MLVHLYLVVKLKVLQYLHLIFLHKLDLMRVLHQRMHKFHQIFELQQQLVMLKLFFQMTLVHKPFFFQAEDGIRYFCLSRGLGDVYKRQCQFHRWTYDTAGTLVGIPKSEHFGELDTDCFLSLIHI